VEGRLVSAEGRPVPDIWVDVWHAAPDGRYDDVSAAFVGRGRVKSDGEGRVTFSTVMPGAYLAPYPGAAARPHIHLLAEAPGFRRLCVQWEIPSRPGERVEEQHPIAVCELRVGPSSTSPWVLTMTAFLDRG
jgi:protocatechuate 3,4-dioxygenase beta subunit